jgi:electron transport complex protein RnfA
MAALTLVFFTALSLNLLLHFALGIKELVRREQSTAVFLYYPWFILFVSTLFLWIFFARILSFTGGFLDVLLIFPLSVLGSMGLEKLFFYALANEGSQHREPEKNPGVFSIGSSYNGLAAAALFLTLRYALSFNDAFFLSLAFSAGGLLAFLIVKEIQRRTFLEAIPHGLRGTPILLVSMGLLSLLFSAVSVLFLKIFL